VILRKAIFTLLLFAGAASAAPSGLFERSVKLYQLQRFEEAVLLLKELTDENKPNPEATSAGLLLTRTYSRLNDWANARQTALDMLRRFPGSRYADWFQFELARLASHTQDRPEALRRLVWIMDHSTNPDMTSACIDHATHLINAGITEDVLLDLNGQMHTPETKKWLELWSARTVCGYQGKAKAQETLFHLAGSDLTESQNRALQSWLNTSSEQLRFPMRIAVLLPLSGEYEDEGHQFLYGLVYALRDLLHPVELILKDTHGSQVEAARLMNELIRTDVSLFIGELDDSRSATLAAMAAQAGKLLICPITTEAGIAGLGDRIFQMNSDIETRGIALARYAYQKLGLRTFAILAPADNYGHDLTDAFAGAIDELGGTIIAQQWYYPGTEDFKRHFQTIRETALAASPPDTAQMNEYLRRRPESGQRVLGTQDDQFDMPVTSIDGFFFPIYEEDLPIIAPQYALGNIKATPLGGDNWNHLDVLRNQRRYINGAVFISGQHLQETEMEYIRFQNSYRMLTSQSPTLLSVLGVDLGRYLVQAIDSGYTDARSLVEYLQQAPLFNGLAGDYQFSKESHVNQSVHLLQYKDGIIQKLEN